MSDVCIMCHNEIPGDDSRRDGTDLLKRNRPELRHVLEEDHVCYPCARKEMIRRTMDELEPVCKKIHDFINKMGHDDEGIVSEAVISRFLKEHRYLQQELILFLIKILRGIGEKSGDVVWEDARNEFALSWCKKAGALS